MSARISGSSEHSNGAEVRGGTACTHVHTRDLGLKRVMARHVSCHHRTDTCSCSLCCLPERVCCPVWSVQRVQQPPGPQPLRLSVDDFERSMELLEKAHFEAVKQWWDEEQSGELAGA